MKVGGFVYHFGINIKEEETLTREKYREYYHEEKQRSSLEDVMSNFDNNIEYFNMLSTINFENEISKFLKRFKKYKEIFDLNECDCYGFYLMVLDKYKQVYIGISDNIKKRIIQHWKKKPHCLIDGDKNTSKLCIDSFKALDTTRIFIYTDSGWKFLKYAVNTLFETVGKGDQGHIKYIFQLLEDDENKMIKYFDNKYTCNRYIISPIRHLYRDFDIIDCDK